MHKRYIIIPLLSSAIRCHLPRPLRHGPVSQGQEERVGGSPVRWRAAVAAVALLTPAELRAPVIAKRVKPRVPGVTIRRPSGQDPSNTRTAAPGLRVRLLPEEF